MIIFPFPLQPDGHNCGVAAIAVANTRLHRISEVHKGGQSFQRARRAGHHSPLDEVASFRAMVMNLGDSFAFKDANRARACFALQLLRAA